MLCLKSNKNLNFNYLTLEKLLKIENRNFNTLLK